MSAPVTNPATPARAQAQIDLAKFALPRIAAGILLIITAVGLLALGIGLCATGNLGGIAAIAVSLPLFFFGSNVTILGRNLMRIAENPDLIIEGGRTVTIAKENFRKILKKDTCCFDSVVNELTEKAFTPTR